MKSSFQINVTYSATVRAGGEAATSLYPRKEEGRISRAGRRVIDEIRTDHYCRQPRIVYNASLILGGRPGRRD